MEEIETTLVLQTGLMYIGMKQCSRQKMSRWSKWLINWTTSFRSLAPASLWPWHALASHARIQSPPPPPFPLCLSRWSFSPGNRGQGKRLILLQVNLSLCLLLRRSSFCAWQTQMCGYSFVWTYQVLLFTLSAMVVAELSMLFAAFSNFHARHVRFLFPRHAGKKKIVHKDESVHGIWMVHCVFC